MFCYVLHSFEMDCPDQGWPLEDNRADFVKLLMEFDDEKSGDQRRGGTWPNPKSPPVPGPSQICVFSYF